MTLTLVTRSALRAVSLVLVAGAAVLAHACSESATGPRSGSESVTTVVAVRLALPGEAVVRALQIARARVVVRREGGAEVYDEFLAVPPSAMHVEFRAELALLPAADGEDFTVEAEVFNTAGATVLRSDPRSVRADPDVPLTRLEIFLKYVGPGWQATRIEVSPGEVVIRPGQAVDFVARAFNAVGIEEPAAPVYWTSLDPEIAAVPNPLVGRAVSGTVRGVARIRAALVSGQAAEASVTVNPLPVTLSIHGGNGQGGTVGSPLPLPLVVRVAAADGLGVAGVPVTFVIESGGGTISADRVITDAEGLASVRFTFGPVAGAVTIVASVPGLAGSPAVFTVVSAPDAAAQLAFLTQPTDAVVGVPMAPIVVEARDEFGNRALAFTGAVTLALESATPAGGAALRAAQTAGVQLLGTLTVNAIGGVATFTNVAVSAPASSLRLRATAVGVASAGTSHSFSSTPGAVTSLVFATQPSNIVALSPLPVIIVHARDALGNLATNYSGVVTLVLSGGPIGVVLQGTAAVQAVGGVATFGGLTVSAAAPAVRLTATGTGVNGSFASAEFAVTQPLTTMAATPASVAFAAVRTLPSPPPATVQITAPGPVSNLTIGAIAYGPGASGWLAASLGGTTTPATLTLTPSTEALGVGTFTANVPITGTGGTSLTLPVSLVVSPLPVSRLAVITQPAGAASGTAFATQPVVELRDATGARVPTATNAVTVQKASGPGTLMGTLTRNAVQGVVTFTDLGIAGTGTHTLEFTSPGLTSATTGSFSVGAALSTVQAVASTTGTVGAPIPAFTPVTASGGVTPYVFALGGGSLPAGMSFSASTGQISGTPTAPLATRTYTVTVTDAVGATSSKTFQLTVNGPLTTTQAVASRASTVNVPIQAFVPVTAAGGTAPYSFALSGGALPAGLTFNTGTGAVSGTPTAVFGPATFTVTVTDAASSTSSKTFSLTINPALTTTQAVASTTGTANAALASFTPVTASAGTTPYTFALSGGALPAGLNFNTTSGLVSGSPTTALALTTFTVTVTDASGATSAKTFQLTVNPPLVTTQAVASVSGTVGTTIPAFTPVTISGGTPPYARVLGGTLPAGMAFNSATGEVSGTPTATLATATFTVFVTDAVGATSSKSFQLTVNPPLTTTQAVASRSGTVDVPIAPFVPVTASGGTPPRTFALSGGALPAGLTFNTATGTVEGTPLATLPATVFTVTVTDATGTTSAKTFTLTVNSALTTTQAVASTAGTVNVAIPAFTPVTASGGTPPLAFALGGGALPPGMSFSTTTGQVSGTPTAPLATTTFTVTVTDAVGAVSSKSFQLTVNGPLVTTQAVPNTTGIVNQLLAAFTPVTASGGTLPYTFALSGGALPAGLSFNTATGQISGTPTAALATTQFTVTVTDGVAASSSKTFNLTIQPAAPTGIALNVSGSASTTITAGTVLAIPLIVDMSGAGSDNLASLTVTVTWNPARFSFTSESAGNGPGWSVISNTSQTATGVLSLTGFATVGTTTTFTLRNLTLTALATGVSVVTPVTASIQTAANELGGAVTVTARNLSVTINP